MECPHTAYCGNAEQWISSRRSRATWREACGIFGIHAPGEEVARQAFFGLYALQHRGQESAGIVVGDGERISMHGEMGLVSQVFDERAMASLQGDLALGHVRYSTTGSNTRENVQPMLGEHKSGPFAVGHNGNLMNSGQLREQLQKQGCEFESTADTEVIVKLIEESSADTIQEAISEAMPQMIGAYSLGIATPTQIIAVRDPRGFRPLSIARMNGGWVIASETCAYGVINAEFAREVRPGEVVSFDGGGEESIQAVESPGNSMCIFEFIYFARPDSEILGKSVYMSRLSMGQNLAKQAPADADIVIGVPQSGIPHALGYSYESDIPYSMGFIKNRYIHRTFIMPDQRVREAGVRMKLAPLKEAIKGRRVVVVDDSIVRGTTTGPEIQLLRESGATEIHLRINCPPIQFPCFYGIDTSTQGQLIAARQDVESIRQHVGADTLTYLNMDNLVKAIGLPKDHFCTACFDEVYPTDVPEGIRTTKYDFESKPV